MRNMASGNGRGKGKAHLSIRAQVRKPVYRVLITPQGQAHVVHRGKPGRDERLIARAHFHWLYHAAAWTALLVALALAAYLVGEGYSCAWPAIAIVLGLAAFLAILLPIWTTEIGVTNQRLIVKRGLLARHTREILLTAVEEVDLVQGALGRILGFGRIDVHGTGDDEVPIPAIAAPTRLSSASRSRTRWRRPRVESPDESTIGLCSGHAAGP